MTQPLSHLLFCVKCITRFEISHKTNDFSQFIASFPYSNTYNCFRLLNYTSNTLIHITHTNNVIDRV